MSKHFKNMNNQSIKVYLFSKISKTTATFDREAFYAVFKFELL